MTEINTPVERVYFLPSVNEPDRLHLWIPAEEYEAMIQSGQLDEAVAEAHPCIGIFGHDPDGLAGRSQRLIHLSASKEDSREV